MQPIPTDTAIYSSSSSILSHPCERLTRQFGIVTQNFNTGTTASCSRCSTCVDGPELVAVCAVVSALEVDGVDVVEEVEVLSGGDVRACACASLGVGVVVQENAYDWVDLIRGFA